MTRCLVLFVAFAGTLALAACDIPPDHLVDVTSAGKSHEDADTGSLFGGQRGDTGVSALNSASFGGHEPVIPGRTP